MGEKIRKARKTAGLTQSQLAEKVGCKQKDVSRWENGRPMMETTLKKLADALGVSMDSLI